MSYRADLGSRTFDMPDGSTWTGEIVATDDHPNGPFGPCEGLEFSDGHPATAGDGFAKLVETPGGHEKYVQGVMYPEAPTRVTLTPDYAARTINVMFDDVLIGVCEG